MSDKNRYWAFVSYVNPIATVKDHIQGNVVSLQDLVKFLDDTHLKYTISPYHDKDVDADGEVKKPKKPHYHVMVCWDGPTTFKCASEILSAVACNGHIESVASARGMYRYFCHLDNPDKFQYPEEERINGNGFTPAGLLSETDKNMIAFEITKIIREKQFIEYGDLEDYLIDEGLQSHYFVLQAKSNHFKNSLNSRRHRFKVQNSTGKDLAHVLAE